MEFKEWLIDCLIRPQGFSHAKAQRRKEKSKQMLLCGFAPLREKFLLVTRPVTILQLTHHQRCAGIETSRLLIVCAFCAYLWLGVVWRIL
jgi:hypothetical protein